MTSRTGDDCATRCPSPSAIAAIAHRRRPSLSAVAHRSSVVVVLRRGHRPARPAAQRPPSPSFPGRWVSADARANAAFTAPPWSGPPAPVAVALVEWGGGRAPPPCSERVVTSSLSWSGGRGRQTGRAWRVASQHESRTPLAPQHALAAPGICASPRQPLFHPHPCCAARSAAVSGCGAGIRRGEMAGDRFTQIAGALFRDPRISFKAKGIFGLISTHRDGWRVTVVELARCGPDGRSAVRSGLEELEAFGYLAREQKRSEDGTLGEVLYAITDAPAHLYELLGDGAATAAVIARSRRSQPESDFPTSDNPTSGDRPPKNTSPKKTRRQNTNSVRPSVRNAYARAFDAPPPQRPPPRQGHKQLPAARKIPTPSDGERLLRAIGARQPELLLTGQVLTDQGRAVQGLLDTGWTPQQLRHVIADRPLPQPLHHTVGAIIAARLRAVKDTTPPDHAAEQPAAQPPASPTDAAGRTVADALTHRVLVECAGCGSPSRAPGPDLCPTCLNWPICTACTGPTPRRADPAGDGRCTLCAT